MDLFIRLGVALAIGLLVGIERGWKAREAPEGARIAGIRTFGLIGLLGGLWAIIGRELGILLLGMAFAVLAALLIFAYLQDVRLDKDIGTTTVVAALVTFALGALAVLDHTSLAAAGAVVTTALLSLKPVLHRWLRAIESRDLFAGIKLLLISVVLLPVLPDRGYGPWDALNPYELWWMVVLIAGISFAGYIAVKVAGPRRGILLTGLFGGLVSSTATTLNLSRLHRRLEVTAAIPAGIVLASAIMFPRMLLEIAVVNATLLPAMLVPLGVMTFTAGGIALWLGRQRGLPVADTQLPVGNPMELASALKFGLLLAVIMLLAEGLHAWKGAGGIYLAASLSGIADVDAITLSLARMARDGIDPLTMERGIVIAAAVNTLFKGVLAVAIAGRGVASRVLPAFALTALSGLGALWLIGA